MFFNEQRPQFFKPLTTKYREQVVECLCLLHQRLYGATAEYGQSLAREQVIDIFEEALARAPLMEADGEELEQRFKSLREQASWILKLLIEHGWMERQVDSANLQSSYPLTRVGRMFAQPLDELDRRRVRTRHRNTRNTLNALEAFLKRGEVHDLLDAFEYSERIISDFTDVISELEDRKRELVRELESQMLVQQASELFFAFMEERFQPDLSVRLSADSVEKHRESIQQSTNKIRRKSKEFKKNTEQQLRQMAPELIIEGQSVLWAILDSIDLRMRNAAEIMLPALRKALQNFTKRADIIIRQLGYITANKDDQWLNACSVLASLPEEVQYERLQKAGEQLATLDVGLIDPAHMKLSQRKPRRSVNNMIEEQAEPDAGAQRDMLIQTLLDQAFTLNNKDLRAYIQTSLADGSRVSSKDLPIESASDLLALAHIIELGTVNNLSSDYRFIVRYVHTEPYTNRYFEKADEFVIELEEKREHD